MYKPRERKLKLTLPYTYGADKVLFINGICKRASRLYWFTCSVCYKECKLLSSGEINRYLKLGMKTYCSKECHISKEHKKTCYMCKQNFVSYDMGNKKSYCSKACYTIWQKSSENCSSNHPNWTGKYIGRNTKRPEYRDWRDKVFKRDNFTCQRCFSNNKSLHAHHIKPYKVYPKLELDLNNGITLCVSCHKEVHKTHDPLYLYKQHA